MQYATYRRDVHAVAVPAFHLRYAAHNSRAFAAYLSDNSAHPVRGIDGAEASGRA